MVIAILRGEPGLRERLSPGSNYLTTTVLGELYLGALLSHKAAENLERIGRFTAVMTVLPCAEETARHYSEIGARLETLGRRIPQNDQWIAASARQHGLTLVHRDDHFEHIDLEGFAQEAWR